MPGLGREVGCREAATAVVRQDAASPMLTPPMLTPPMLTPVLIAEL